MSLCWIFCFALPLIAADWKPITEAELALKAPLVEKYADAEAIFWEVQVADSAESGDPQAVLRHYIRIKIFNERGRENGKVEFAYSGKTHISDIAGRTIKRNGATVNMAKDAVFDKDVVKGKGLKLRAKSFTLPDVQPGDIIEYQWQQTDSGVLSNYMRLYLQRSIPIQSVRYRVKPLQLDWLPYTMKSLAFHVEPKRFEPAGQGFSAIEYRNMPAFKEEPYMPPADNLRAWILIYYAPDDERVPEKYWPKFAKTQYAKFKELIKLNSDIKRIATEVVSGSKTDDERIRALYAWIHKNVRNVNTDTVSSTERELWKPNHNTAETFRQGIGTGLDINLLFLALANAARLEASMALTGNRSDLFFDPVLVDGYFLRAEEVAIHANGAWKFYDPSSPFLPCGLVPWREQGTKVLITDPKQPEWVDSRLSSAPESLEEHLANFKLDAEGSLSGPASIAWLGHKAVAERARLHSMNPAERDQYLINELKQTFTEAEVTQIVWNDIENPEKPLAVNFSIVIPKAFQRTGKRFFVQAALFHRSEPVLFPSSTRKYPIYFEYPWSERDQIAIEVPLGYVLDHADMPTDIVAGDVVQYKSKAAVTPREPFQLTYTRSLQVSGIYFPVEAYSTLKQVFDGIHERDQHAILLKQISTGAGK
jgi:hypothetical protein